MATQIASLCGQLIVGGYLGEEPPTSFLDALRRGERAGAILFKRNLPTWQAAHSASMMLADATADNVSPIVAVDQEGGRVQRLGLPVLQVPSMRRLGEAASEELVAVVGRTLGSQLAQIGFNVNFAPVLDVDTNPANPVIGDRSFSRDPEVVARLGVAFMVGMQASGIASCGKHFPGHGDTTLDSHIGLPTVDTPMQRLHDTELRPFRAAIDAGIDAIMSAHIVVACVDPQIPATLCDGILNGMLRKMMGFDGVVFSDDLEMGAIAQRYDTGTAAVRAVRAGCDVLLICKSEERQAVAHEALVHEAESNQQFLQQCKRAAYRCRALRKRRCLQTTTNPNDINWAASEALQERIDALR